MAQPISIYRFLDCHAALKTLEAGKFRVGLLSKFNDPFEWQLGFTNITTPQEQKFVEEFKVEHQQWLETWMGIGFRCLLEETDVKKLLNQNGFVDTQIVRAKMCSETYTINC